MIFIFEGDCNNSIYLWDPTSAATWNVDNAPFIGHAASVEDLQVCVLMQSHSCFSCSFSIYFLYCTLSNITSLSL